MERRWKKWFLLLLLISWISITSQRPITDIPDSQFSQPENENNVFSMWMSEHNFPTNDQYLRTSLKLQDTIQDADYSNRDKNLQSIENNADDIWMSKTSYLWLSPQYLQLQLQPPQHHPRKRGFSMLSRFQPFNSMNKQRTSIRNINDGLFPHPGPNDMVSAKTRTHSRPSGQPLRWG